MADGQHVSIRLTHTVGEKVFDMTVRGNIDSDGTFRGVQLGRGGSELVIPHAQDLVIPEPNQNTLVPVK
jgi:hypothetical protein